MGLYTKTGKARMWVLFVHTEFEKPTGHPSGISSRHLELGRNIRVDHIGHIEII